MDFIFADDSRQLRPTRLGVRPLVAIGGVFVPGHAVGSLERAIDALCKSTGFPAGQQFKWSPGANEPFMRALVGEERVKFYSRLLELATAHAVTACVVIEDSECNPANEDSLDPEHDVTTLFFERVDSSLRHSEREGVLVVAEPSGGRANEAQFLARCLATIEEGTRYTALTTLPVGVFLAPSRRLRVLQLADVVTSCTVSRVSGEMRYSREIFDLLRPLYQKAEGRIGGAGVKLHPDFRYGNLYHWLLGDETILRRGTIAGLPEPGAPFADHPNEPVVVEELLKEEKQRSRR